VHGFAARRFAKTAEVTFGACAFSVAQRHAVDRRLTAI